MILRCLLFFSALFIFSCNNTAPENILPLFHDAGFTLHPGEKNVQIIPKFQNNWQKLTDTLSIPLFKYIEGSDYRIYAGLPYNTDLKKLNAVNLFPNQLKNAQSDPTALYRTYDLDARYLAEYCVDYQGNLLYFLTETDSAARRDSLFSSEKFAARIVSF